MKRPFSIRLGVSDLAAASSDTADYQLNNGETFVAESATREVIGAALTNTQESARVIPLVTVNLKDNTSGQNIFSEPLMINTIAGDAKNPYFFNRPLRFKSKPLAEFASLCTDATYKRVDLVLHGYIDDGQPE